MGLLDKLGLKKVINWEDAHKANPQFYGKDGELRCNFVLTEGTKTILPIDPKESCKDIVLEGDVGMDSVDVWMLSMVCITRPGVMFEVEYEKALPLLQSMARDSKDGYLLMGYTGVLDFERIVSECGGRKIEM